MGQRNEWIQMKWLGRMGNGAQLLAVLLTMALALVASRSAAWAIVDVNKSFAPINIFPGETSTLTISLFNSNTVPATGTAFTDVLPATVTATSVIGNTCGGTVSISPNTQVALSGGTVPAGDGINSGTCAVTAIVTSNTSGTYVNTIPVGGVTSSEGSNPLAANATLTVATVLGEMYPNPFNPSTTIPFTLVSQEGVSLRIYDASGKLVRTLVDEVMPAGVHQTVWDGRDNSGSRAATGVYFVRFATGDYLVTRKLVMIK